jgi:16S rRNA (cytidine1402-2'-O)-methyltransferase
MPLNLPIDKISQEIQKGCLYIVATPLGNLNDVTLRTIFILANVDWIAAEDTRTTTRLLSNFGIRAKLISCHEHNEIKKIPHVIDRLKAGKTIALVSNAGTPAISDPGYRLVKAVVTEGISVTPVPGACAAVAALAASGLPTDSYIFVGFPPKKTGKQIRQLKQLISEPRTLIFYESPRRLLSLIDTLITVMGDRKAVLARELTKIHEEFLRGRLSEIKQRLNKRKEIKGECTLLIHGAIKTVEISWQDVHLDIEQALSSGNPPLAELSKKIAKKYNIPKKKVYNAALRLKKTIHQHCFNKREVI